MMAVRFLGVAQHWGAGDMGFFSSIGGLMGGSKSSSQSGYGALPKVAQEAMDAVTKQGSAMLLGGAGNSMFTPLGTTGQEQQAYGLMQQPTTAAGVTSLTNNFMNPYTSFITDNINREAGGQYSLYKSALSNSGQLGSNREFLNASAQDEARLNAIGTALSGQYNTAQNTALTQNQQTIQNLMGQGEQERSLDAQTNQAPLAALQAMAKLLGVYPASSQLKETKSNGILGSVGDIAKVSAMLSDRRAKTGVVPVGEKNGFNLYEFAYTANPEKRFIGVMADEVEAIAPEAVSVGDDGFKRVDYGKLGFDMEEV